LQAHKTDPGWSYGTAVRAALDWSVTFPASEIAFDVTAGKGAQRACSALAR
jgi:hypothetical protein